MAVAHFSYIISSLGANSQQYQQHLGAHQISHMHARPPSPVASETQEFVF